MTHPQQPYPPIEPRKRRAWPWIVGGVVAAIITVSIASNAGSHSSTSTTTAAGSAATGAAPAAPAAPAVPSFSDGTHEIGADIPAGKYKTPGPDPDAAFQNCYWARLKNTDGTFDAIIANGNTKGAATITLKPSDGAVEASGGCTWTKADQ